MSTKSNSMILTSLLLPSNELWLFISFLSHSGLTLINQVFSLSNIIPPLITSLNGPIDFWFITLLNIFCFYRGYYYSISWLEMTSHILLKTFSGKTVHIMLRCCVMSQTRNCWIQGWNTGLSFQAQFLCSKPCPVICLIWGTAALSLFDAEQSLV